MSIDQFIKEDPALWDAIVGALRDCINQHGPITKEDIGSAAKRIIGQIKSRFESESGHDDRPAKCRCLDCQHRNMETRGCKKDGRIRGLEDERRCRRFLPRTEG